MEPNLNDCQGKVREKQGDLGESCGLPSPLAWNHPWSPCQEGEGRAWAEWTGLIGNETRECKGLEEERGPSKGVLGAEALQDEAFPKAILNEEPVLACSSGY